MRWAAAAIIVVYLLVNSYTMAVENSSRRIEKDEQQQGSDK